MRWSHIFGVIKTSVCDHQPREIFEIVRLNQAEVEPYPGSNGVLSQLPPERRISARLRASRSSSLGGETILGRVWAAWA